ncbi:DUF1569 domain-containing protein [Marinicella sp. W31]|uniref:DUF1569 domain-containing protein n=1 Tax=Marinicella sp. W31 TaxID=3023713 RepID=UPI00375811C6
MRRRQLLKFGLLGTAGVAVGGFVWLRNGKPDRPLTIEASLQVLRELQQLKLSSTGNWSPFQIFSHLAQSVEYSMQGFPQSKSPWIQNTVGSLAFHAFSAAGNMKHALDEVIPGAPLIKTEGDAQLAITRLSNALKDFEAFSGSLKPHFMYGDLSKSQYTLAHILHVNNHLVEIKG